MPGADRRVRARRRARRVERAREASSPGASWRAYANLATVRARTTPTRRSPGRHARWSSPSSSARPRSLLSAPRTDAARLAYMDGVPREPAGARAAAGRGRRGGLREGGRRASGSQLALGALLPARAYEDLDRFVAGRHRLLRGARLRDVPALPAHDPRAGGAERARWAEATEAATLVLHDPGPSILPRSLAGGARRWCALGAAIRSRRSCSTGRARSPSDRGAIRARAGGRGASGGWPGWKVRPERSEV